MGNKNVVIKVENEREYKALMKYYEAKGWRWHNRTKASNEGYRYFKQDGGTRTYIGFHDRFLYSERVEDYETCIPFAHLAAIEGIELEPEEVIIEMSNRTATVVDGWVRFNIAITDLSRFEVEEIYTALKSFEK